MVVSQSTKVPALCDADGEAFDPETTSDLGMERGLQIRLCVVT